jgi:ATP-dependent DNA helicase RecQ
VIFHDATLMAMLETRPKNRQQMALISGIGVRKMELYADLFLAVIKEFAATDDEIPGTASESANLFRLGFTVKQIAQQRSLQDSTIYGHLAQFLEQGTLELTDVVDLPPQEIKHIEEAILNLPEEQKNALKPVFEQFDGLYDYGLLRCVRAALLHKTA